MPVLRDFRPPAGGEILNLTCTLAKGAFTPNFSTMSDVASVIPGLLCLGFIGWIVSKIWNSMTSAEPVTVPQTLPDVRPKPPFDLYRDARGPTPLFGFPVEFSSKYEASLYPNIVTGLTLNRDYLAVRRGSYGVKAFLLDQNLTVGITAGVPPGFKEAAQYTMELESETEVARFPISFHSTGFKAARAPDTPEMEKEYFLQYRLVRSALFQTDTMEVLVSLLASGACDRYPDLRFVLGESGVTWLPYVFDRLDTEYHDRARGLGFKMKPSDYFRRQGYVTYQQDQFLEPIVPLVGEDNIMWGSDYPHPDCLWPDSPRILAENLAALKPSVRRKIVSETAAGLYGIKV